jgi:hypothetical protein
LKDEQKITLLFSALDEVTFEIVQHLPVPVEGIADYAYYRKVVKDRFEPVSTVNERRLHFRNERQVRNESYDSYYERLLLASEKAYPNEDVNIVDSNICDQFIAGISDQGIKIKLLEQPPKDSRDALASAKRIHAAQQYGRVINQHATTETFTIDFNRGRGSSRGRFNQFAGYGRNNSSMPSRTPDGRPICFKCRKPNHLSQHCKARLDRSPPSFDNESQKCFRCGRAGHIANQCRISQERLPSSISSRIRSRETSPVMKSFKRSQSPQSSFRSRSQRDSYATSLSPPRVRFDDNQTQSASKGQYRDDHCKPNKNKKQVQSTRENYLVGNVCNYRGNHIYVRGYINECLNYMIVDTGSVVSLISKNLFDKINSENLLLVEPMQDNLRGVTNDAINIIGAVNISVRLVGGSNCILSNEFLIADGIAPECLLGLNFLNKYNAKIDMTNKKLIINSYDQTFKHNLVNKPYNDMPVPVYLVYKQTVKAFTQMFVIVRFSADDCDIDDDWNSVEEVIYAPNVHIADKYNLLVANCVVPIRGNTMYVHVANMTNNDVEIYPGTPFGTAEPYDEHEYESINSVNEYDESINSKTHVLYRDEIDTDEEEKRNKINDRLIKCRNGYHDGWYESDEENFYGSDIERVLKLPLKTSEWIKYSGLDCDMSKMNYEEKQDVLQLIAKYRQAFAQHEHDYGRTDIIKHKIELKSGTSPVRMAPYRMSPPQREIVEKHIGDMLRDGIIQESSGEFSSPIVLVKKKDGSIRFAVDYRRLNSNTVKDAYPLPRIEDCHDSLSGAQWFSTLDLQAGYWQIAMDEQDSIKTSFASHLGTYKFSVMPYGLCNGPATFQRAMDAILKSLKWRTLLVYLDDVIVHSKTLKEHIERLGEVFQRLLDAGLKLKPVKTHLFKREVEYLGHMVSGKGIAPLAAKVHAIKHFPQPKTIKQVRSFLGLASYYRKFIKNFASIAKPLHSLSEKGREFQ